MVHAVTASLVRAGTAELIEEWGRTQPDWVTVRRHAKNQGKGRAVRTGLAEVSGECVIIQDGDFEYDPRDYPRLLARLGEGEGEARVVYGSRLLGNNPRMFFTQRVGNVVLTWLTNVLYGSSLTDMETCYKLFARDVVAGMILTSNRFNVEPELTAKVLRCEIPIRARTWIRSICERRLDPHQVQLQE